MALNKDRVADNILDRLEADFGFVFTPTQRARARIVWNLVADEIFKEIKTYGEIQLLNMDIKVDPGTFTAGLTPVTGEGFTKAVNLEGRLE